jgi:hypothetical protein
MSKTTSGTGKKSDGVMITDIKGAEAALNANVAVTQAMSWGGTTYTAAEVEGMMEGILSVHDDVDTTKAAYVAAVAKWKATRPEAKAMWDTYVAWVELTYGKDDATKKKFNIPMTPPKPKLTAEQVALRNAKLRATAEKKAAAKKAAAPKAEALIAVDANGAPIGSASATAVANLPAPAVPAVAGQAAK